MKNKITDFTKRQDHMFKVMSVVRVYLHPVKTKVLSNYECLMWFVVLDEPICWALMQTGDNYLFSKVNHKETYDIKCTMDGGLIYPPQVVGQTIADHLGIEVTIPLPSIDKAI